VTSADLLHLRDGERSESRGALTDAGRSSALTSGTLISTPYHAVDLLHDVAQLTGRCVIRAARSSRAFRDFRGVG
jgi:hypothetical protein